MTRVIIKSDSVDRDDSVIAVADLRALTVTHDPARVRALPLELAALLLACGVDPRTGLRYVQSHVPEHTELHYLRKRAAVTVRRAKETIGLLADAA